MSRRISLFAVFVSARVFAAACCGGGASFPSLLLGDDKAQLAVSSAYAAVIGDAPAKGRAVFRAGTDDEAVVTSQLDAAAIVSDRWQLGASVPVVNRARTTSELSQSAFGVGDVSLTGAYEALPEWSYSAWKPRGFVFAQLTLPTGGSVYNSSDLFAVNARGRGFVTPAVGALFLKILAPWDFAFRARIGHSLDRVFALQDESGAQFYVRPSTGFAGAINIGVSPTAGVLAGNWRFGVGLETVFEGASNVAGSQLVWNTSADIARAFLKTWSVALAYNDQTLLGPARNVTLSRGVALSLRHRWER